MSIWKRIGGENAITFQAWLLLAPISVFLTGSFVPEGSSASYLVWLVIGTLAHLASGVVLLFARFTFLSNKPRKSRPITALLTFVVAGMARGATVAISGEWLGALESAELLLRMRSGAALSIFWFALAAVIIDASKKYKAAIYEIQDRLAEINELEKSAQISLKTYRDQIIKEVEGIITSAFQKAQNVGQLRDVIDQVVRPLSNRLYSKDTFEEIRESVRQENRVRKSILIRETVASMFQRAAFNPLTVSIIAVGGTAASRLWTSDPMSFILDVTINLLWIYLGLTLPMVLTQNRPKLQALLSLPTWIVVGMGSGVITELVTFGTIANIGFGATALTVNVVAVCVFSSLFYAYEYERSEKLKELEHLIEQANWLKAKSSQAIWSERKRLSRIIHSDIQGSILATSNRLGRIGAETLDKATLDLLHDQCYQAMLSSETIESPAEFLAETKEVWSDSVNIVSEASSEIFEALGNDSTAAAATIEVIRESINNAVKHAKPKDIAIDLEITRQEQTACIKLEITSDGVENKELNSPGLGSKVLDEVTTKWSREIQGNKVKLTAEIPLLLVS